MVQSPSTETGRHTVGSDSRPAYCARAMPVRCPMASSGLVVIDVTDDRLPGLVASCSRTLVKMHTDAGAGHLGGNLSCLPGLLAIVDRLGPNDQLILSKGHSAGALYVALASKGLIPPEQLSTFYQDGTKLPGHPPVNAFDAIPFATGSLGHGLSLAAGLALGNKLRGSGDKVFCLTSDGEWQEGSTWEALIFASHHCLQNLTVLVDHNGWQALGRTSDVASMSPLWERVKGFPIDTSVIDGDDIEAIAAELERHTERLRIIFLETTKGRGVASIADTLRSHYVVLSDDELKTALADLGAGE
jgi:transketolase